uniref:C2H2-type domain-containing protein n=1 Tax=Graphocephala atropunctata TaxID=36148 RepID=A0A1B6KJW8_9HEMI
MGEVYIKEEIVIDDAGVSECEDETNLIENKPFTLCFENDRGKNVLERYNLVNSPTSFEEVESSQSKRKLPNIKYQRKISKHRSRNKNAKNHPKEKKLAGNKRSSADNLEKSYSCRICSSEFKERKIFVCHLNQHFTVDHNIYFCGLCEYQCNFKSHINRHVTRTHCLDGSLFSDQRTFACSICSMRFFERKDLERHNYVHTRSGPLKCNMCPYSHITKYGLMRHMQCHTIDKITSRPIRRSRFECHHCGRIFYCKSELTKHVVWHLGIYRYTCDECGYKCYARADFLKHCTIHSEERPFVCNQCFKTFKRRAHLISHTRSKYICKNISETENKC